MIGFKDSINQLHDIKVDLQGPQPALPDILHHPDCSAAAGCTFLVSPSACSHPWPFSKKKKYSSEPCPLDFCRYLVRSCESSYGTFVQNLKKDNSQ